MLVEAMVGIFLIGISLTGVFSALGRSLDLIEEARDSTRVAQIIQSELEDLRTLSWSEVDALAEWDVYVPNSSFSEEFGNRYTCYRYIFSKSSDQYGLRVYVLWTNNSGRTKYDYFETWYTEGGFNDYYYRSF
ncbi:hypothetical protein VDG1235_1308 [Verrucomicrobiia bacterium DG1235]|nr:hypothetical protein VDG1235_1308 [Verrucomicrobiae bacterium DG1235]